MKTWQLRRRNNDELVGYRTTSTIEAAVAGTVGVDAYELPDGWLPVILPSTRHRFQIKVRNGEIVGTEGATSQDLCEMGLDPVEPVLSERKRCARGCAVSG